MPKNKFQDVIYTIIMASVMVYGMVAYNIVLNTGSMQNWVFLAVFHEWPEQPDQHYACYLGCIRMADVPVHELLCHPAVQGQP